MSDGFVVEPVICGGCSAYADGLAHGNEARGLPEGWISVVISSYARTSPKGVTSAFKHIGTAYYCSAAHLPSELLRYAEAK